MSEIHSSFKEVAKAYNKVRGELIRLEVLWRDSRLDRVPCLYEIIPLEAFVKGWMGWWDSDGAIHFPSVYLQIPYLRGSKNSAVDVLRHEFGHALADRYPKALRDGDLFKKAFGGPYGDRPAKGTDPDDWEGRCVSRYAATATQEDFAETFMFFLKHKGKIPARFANKPAIRKKWKAVAEIVRRVASSPR
jgi:hypothetical protein